MNFWKVEIKYSKIAIPDTIYFSDKAQAQYFLEMKKENNSNVRWATISDEPVELKEESPKSTPNPNDIIRKHLGF